ARHGSRRRRAGGKYCMAALAGTTNENWNAPEIGNLGRSLCPPLPPGRSFCSSTTAWSRGGRSHFRQAQPARRHRGAVRSRAAERIRGRATGGSGVQPLPRRTARSGGQDRGTPRAGTALRPRRVDRRGRGPRRASFSRSNRRLSGAGLRALRSFATSKACIVLEVPPARHLAQSVSRIFRRCLPGDPLVRERLVFGPLVFPPDGNEPVRPVHADLGGRIGKFTDAIDRRADPPAPEQEYALLCVRRQVHGLGDDHDRLAKLVIDDAASLSPREPEQAFELMYERLGAVL